MQIKVKENCKQKQTYKNNSMLYNETKKILNKKIYGLTR